ncbi:hypothetical protein L0244_01445 [bacterium]|nr:hypothetical protein [bacterium]
MTFERVANWTIRTSITSWETIKGVEEKAEKEIMRSIDPNKYPPGLDRRRVQEIIDHYDNQEVFGNVAQFSDYGDWISQIVKERLRLEESLIRDLKKRAANGNNKKRCSSGRTVVAR